MSSKCLGGGLNLQFNGIILVSPGRSIHLFGTKDSRSRGPKVVKTKWKLCYWVTRDNSVVTPISTSWFLDLWVLAMGGIILYLRWFRAYTAFWRTFGSPARYCHLAGAVTESSKGHSIVLSSQLLQVGGKCDNTNDFHSNISFAVNWDPIRSNSVWNTTMVNKALCKSTNSSLGRSTWGRQNHSQNKCLF